MLNIVKNTTMIGPMDLLAPHSCRGCGRIGPILCERCKKYILEKQHNICPKCKKPNSTGNCPNCPNLPPTFIGGERTGLLADIVQSYKYNSIRALSFPLAEIIAHALPSFSLPSSIVPLPTIPKHIRIRGFDHTSLMAKQLSKITNYPVSPILSRAKNTVQVGTSHAKRSQQAREAYTLSGATIDPSVNYILLDDVWTTGASMQAAIKKLQQAGVKHISIAILSLSRLT